MLYQLCAHIALLELVTARGVQGFATKLPEMYLGVGENLGMRGEGVENKPVNQSKQDSNLCSGMASKQKSCSLTPRLSQWL